MVEDGLRAHAGGIRISCTLPWEDMRKKTYCLTMTNRPQFRIVPPIHAQFQVFGRSPGIHQDPHSLLRAGVPVASTICGRRTGYADSQHISLYAP